MDCCLPKYSPEEIPLSPATSTDSESWRCCPGRSSLNKEKKKRFTGYGLMYFGTFLLSVGLVFSRGLDSTVPHAQLNGLRFTAQMLISIPLVIICTGGDFRVEKGLVGWFLGAIVALISGTYSFYGSSFYLPVVVAGSVKRIFLLIFNYVISFVVNRTVTWYEIVALVLCIPGATMLTASPALDHEVKPFDMDGSFISPCTLRYKIGNDTSEFYIKKIESQFSNDSDYSDIFLESMGNHSSNIHSIQRTKRPTEQEKIVIGYLLCIMDSIATTVFYQIMKRKLSEVNVFVCCFWGSLIGLVISYCMMGMTETPVFPSETVCILVMTADILFAGCSMFFTVRAIQLLPSELTALMGSLQIPNLFLFQYTVLSVIYSWHAHVVEVCGSAMVFVGSVFVPFYESLHTFCFHKTHSYQERHA